MNKVLIAVIVFVVVLGGGYFLLKSQPETSPAMSENVTVPSERADEKTEEEGSVVTSSGKYVMYSNEVLEANKDKRRVLFFYANWCPTCRPADSDFMKKVNMIPEDIVVIRVNYNDSDTDEAEKSLASKYGITYQHTFVQIDSDGNEVTKWNGGQTDELLENIK